MKINLLKISAISMLLLAESPAFAAFYKEALSRELPPKSMQSTRAYIQQKAVTGTVTDEKNQPLPGAVIKNTKTGVSTQTDVNGKFIVQATEGDVITISYIGYDTQTITIGSQSTLSILLKPSSKDLNEVVVVGYGSQNRDQVTSAVAHVTPDEFRQSGARNPLDLIQGKVPGLQLSRTSGSNPNSGVSVQLRGAVTVTGSSSPLFVIDGIPGGNPDLLQQDDIASIDVLKDGSAAAIYGSTANAGVIIITTKKGKEGPPQFNYSNYFRKEYLQMKPDFLTADQYRQRIASGQIKQQDFGSSTDFYDLLINHSNLSQYHNFNASGGSKNSSYRASITYRDLQGIAKENSRTEYTFRMNVTQTGLNDRLKLQANLATNINRANLLGGGGWESEATKNPTLSNFNPDGSYRFDLTSTNEYARLFQETNKRKQQTTSGDARAELTILKGLKATAFASYTRDSYLDGAYALKASENSVENTSFPNGGYASRNTVLNQNLAFEPTIEYSTTIAEKHNLSAIAVYSYRYGISEGFNASNRGFINDLFHEDKLSQGSALSVGKATMESYKNDNTLIAFLGRVNYGYDNNKYLFQFSLRREGSSRFGTNNKWGNFPAASAGWTITQENFMKSLTAINYLKLRVGYGVTGNSGFSNNASRVTLSGGGRYLYPDGNYYETYGPDRNPNPDLKWETKRELNIGLDFTVLNNKLSGTIDLFNRTTKDLLDTYTAPVPPFVRSSLYTNVGQISSKGIELGLSYAAIKRKNFSWNMDATFSTLTNKLDSYSNAEYKVNYLKFSNIYGAGDLGQAITTYEGGSLGEFWGKRFAGFTPDGKWLFYNRNGEAVPNAQINNSADRNVTDLARLGNAIPKYYASWTSTFAYKNWDFRLFVRGKFGYKILNTTALTYGNRTWSGNLLEETFGKYSQINDTYMYSDYYLENGSFVKLDEATLGYNFKFKNKYLRTMRLYLAGNNLFTITGFTAGDPDFVPDTGAGRDGGNNPNASIGVGNRGIYPSTRSIIVGLNFGF